MDNKNNEANQHKVIQENVDSFAEFFATLKQGFRSQFKDGEHVIECWSSGVSGKEVVYFNGEEVSEQNNWSKRRSLHQFSRDGHEYEVENNLISIRRGEFQHVLIKDGVHLATQIIKSPELKNKKPFSWKGMLIDIAIYGAIGYAVGYAFATWFSDDKTALAEKVQVLIEPLLLFVG